MIRRWLFKRRSVESFQLYLSSLSVPPTPHPPHHPQWKQGLIWPRPPACWDSCSDDLGSPQVPWFIFWVNTTNSGLDLKAVPYPAHICKFLMITQFDVYIINTGVYPTHCLPPSPPPPAFFFFYWKKTRILHSLNNKTQAFSHFVYQLVHGAHFAPCLLSWDLSLRNYFEIIRNFLQCSLDNYYCSFLVTSEEQLNQCYSWQPCMWVLLPRNWQFVNTADISEGNRNATVTFSYFFSSFFFFFFSF